MRKERAPSNNNSLADSPCVSSVLLLAASIGFEAEAVSTSGRFYQQLLSAQRQGSCSELPRLGVGIHTGRIPDYVNDRLTSEIQAQVVRFDLPWIEIEHQGKYDFHAFDPLVDRLRQSGKSLILILDYGHPDHSDGRAANGVPLPPRTPEQRSAYARYVRAVAEHYRGKDIVFEIWNEPNLDLFWPPHFDADAYGALLADAVTAIRDGEPNATVLPAGLANENDPSQFAGTLATTGALAHTDGIAFHPYRQNAPENSLYDLAKFRAASGVPERPLWITEWGYSEGWLGKVGYENTRSRQAVMIARVILTAALTNAKALLTYDLVDDGTNAGDQESSFGLYDYDLRPKAAATAFRLLASLMSQCDSYEFTVDNTEQIITASFRSATNISQVIWAFSEGFSRELCYTPPGRPVGLTDVMGNHRAIEMCGGRSIKLEFPRHRSVNIAPQ